MSIKKKFAASSLWAVAGNAANNLVSFLIFVILARLLDPHAVGLVAFALIFIEIGRIVVFGGLPEAVIQRKDWDDAVASTCFFANLIAAVAFLAVVAGLVAPLLSHFYQPEAGPVLASLAAIYVIDAVRAIHEAKLRREFRYRPLAIRASIATALSGAIGVGMALYGFEVWSLVAQRLVNAVILTLLTWRATAWVPSRTLSWPILKELSDFILHLTPARLLVVVTSKVIDLTSGLILGPAALAFLRVGARGLEVIAQFTVAPLQQAALSAFSRLGSTRAMGEAYLRVTRVCAAVACPVYLGAATVAPDFVLLVFGPQWGPSGIIMAVLALAIGPLSLGYFIQPALTAAGRPRTLLFSTTISLAATLVAALTTVWWGIFAMAVGQTVQQYVAILFRLQLLAQTLEIGRRRLLSGVAPAYLAALAMAAVVFGLRRTLLAEMTPLPRLLISAAVGAVLYPAIMLLFARSYVHALRVDLLPLLPGPLRRLAAKGAWSGARVDGVE